MSPKARPARRVPAVPLGILSSRYRLPQGPVSDNHMFPNIVLTYVLILHSPKPSLPPARAYETPEPPSQRELGPPPPGYGRYADFDRGAAGGGPSHGPGPAGPRRNLDEVLCFKVCHRLSTALDARIERTSILVRRERTLCQSLQKSKRSGKSRRGREETVQWRRFLARSLFCILDQLDNLWRSCASFT